MPHYHIDDDLSKAQGVDGDLERLVINYFRELVDNDKYQVIAVSLPVRQNWQTRDKIH